MVITVLCILFPYSFLLSFFSSISIATVFGILSGPPYKLIMSCGLAVFRFLCHRHPSIVNLIGGKFKLLSLIFGAESTISAGCIYALWFGKLSSYLFLSIKLSNPWCSSICQGRVCFVQWVLSRTIQRDVWPSVCLQWRNRNWCHKCEKDHADITGVSLGHQLDRVCHLQKFAGRYDKLGLVRISNSMYFQEWNDMTEPCWIVELSAIVCFRLEERQTWSLSGAKSFALVPASLDSWRELPFWWLDPRTRFWKSSSLEALESWSWHWHSCWRRLIWGVI